MNPRQRTCWLAVLLVCVLVAACTAPPGPGNVAGSASIPVGATAAAGLPHDPPTRAQVLWGRQLVITHDCAGCHGGAGPAGEEWLAGGSSDHIGEYTLWRPNLTPDEATGLGRFSDRQIFNALRYGLRPSATPDAEITSATPGAGGHPERPNYLSPGMPWTSWRHMSDRELWAVIAYLRHGVAPARNAVPPSEMPSDLWAGWFTAEQIGSHPIAAFPTAHEELRDGASREQVLRGRGLAASTGCGECHGGRGNPAAEGWLVGVQSAERRPHATPFEQKLQVGPFATYPRNLTPDNTTGLGRFSERQIFNALRYGLRPGETADVEIISTVPGEGNHPLHPKYLAPSMPWASWRHLQDEELWAIAAYLKHGLKPVRNRVPDSEGPPDFWVSLFTPENFGTYPAPAFPTDRERQFW